jgi:pyruvate dehydrogenase E2 component (dihydrolipoamide acetyltransferase)
MPKLSPTMTEGTLIKWHKKIGEHVEAGELLIEVATDKATVEYQALDSGWLRKILIPEGKNAIVNQAIAIFTLEKQENIESYKPEGVLPETPSKQQPERTQSAEKEEGKAVSPQVTSQINIPAFVPLPPLKESEFAFPTSEMEARMRVSPLAKKLAKERGLDLSTVKGSGPGERIVSRDLERAQPAAALTFGRRERPHHPAGTYEEESFSPMRKVIAQRLQESKSFIPHFYVQQTLDAIPLTLLREQLEAHGLKVTVNDCIVRASALALRQHPQINSGFNSVNQTIVHFKTIDISVAVSVNNGLITPIIRYADYKNIGEISLEVRSLSLRAKEGKLEAHEYQGGSFTLSNLGMYGISNFQAIINPPQAAILAIGGIQETAVVKEGKVLPGKTITLTLSADHRVIDGVAAATFLRTLKKYLENPAGLLL